jgi:hypothetical protein
MTALCGSYDLLEFIRGIRQASAGYDQTPHDAPYQEHLRGLVSKQTLIYNKLVYILLLPVIVEYIKKLKRLCL